MVGSVPVVAWNGSFEDATDCAVLVWSDGRDLAVGWKRGHIVVTASTWEGEWPTVLRRRLEGAALSAAKIGPAAMDDAFDPDWLTSQFTREATVILEAFGPQVVLAEPASSAMLTERHALSPGSRYLASLMGRIFFTQCLQTKGWFEFQGRRDYLQALYDDTRRRPNSMGFHERISNLTMTGLHERDRTGWPALASVLGSVQFLGRSVQVVSPIDRALMVPELPAIVPPALFDRLLGPDGLCNSFPFDSRSPEPHVRRMAMDLESLAHAMESLRTRSPLIQREELRGRCRAEIAEFLGTDPSLATLQPEWKDRLWEFHVFDPRCGRGAYLLAMLHELVELHLRLGAKTGDVTPAHEIAARLINENIRGVEANPAWIHIARVRLLQSYWAWEDGEAPRLRPDVESAVRIGEVAGMGRGYGRVPRLESRCVEFKATLDWNVLRGERDPNLRLGFLRSLCAFLNSQGGTVYLGVADDGSVLGLSDDLDAIDDPNPHDVFEGRIRQLAMGMIDPPPLDCLDVRFEPVRDSLVCMVTVPARPGVTYLVQKRSNGKTEEDVYVRDGPRTIRLTGRVRDQFVVRRYAPEAAKGSADLK